MKRVSKGISPAEFEDWKAQANDDWQPTYDDLRNPEKSILKAALLAEQGWVCCYCGQSIEDSGSHIEHFRPQSQRDDLALDYDNLHASCLRAVEPGRPLHCGHAKDDDFDEGCHICPTEPDCESRFVYTQLGQIAARHPDDAAASAMIKLLALDSPRLCSQREEKIKSTFDAAFLETVTADELKALRDAYRRPKPDGKLESFGHAIARYAEQQLMLFEGESATKNEEPTEPAV